MGIRERLLEEDCNRCEGDIPENATPKVSADQNIPMDDGVGDIFEENLEEEFKKLLR